MQFPSVRLFVDRAQAARPDFQVTRANAAAVAGLCVGLEGLALALELAAARAGILSPGKMLAGLESRFDLLVSRRRTEDPRHGSLRAALDWSYELLSPALQRFFRELTVFQGGWTSAAAAAVCDTPRAGEFLEELRESSLVLAEASDDMPQRAARALETPGQSPRPVGSSPSPADRLPVDERRFRLLETLREYGAEQLAPAERVDLERRHAGYFWRWRRQQRPGSPVRSRARGWIGWRKNGITCGRRWYGQRGAARRSWGCG
jgi:predicted ATPase